MSLPPADAIVLGEATTELSLPGPDVLLPDPDRVTAVSETHGIRGA